MNFRKNRFVRRTAALFAAVLLLISLAGCDLKIPEQIQTKTIRGDAVPQTVPLSADAGDGLAVKIDLVLADTENTPVHIRPLPAGEQPYAVVSCPADFADYGFFARQDGDGVFSVGTENKFRFRAPDFRLDIYAPVSSCTLAGELEVEMDCGGEACPDHVTLTLSGAVDFSAAALDTENVTVTVTGAADIDLAGTCGSFFASIEGAGEIDAEELSSSACTVSITGAGSAGVWASDTLDVSVTGAGSVIYKGNPAITKKIAGAGSVVPKSDD